MKRLLKQYFTQLSKDNRKFRGLALASLQRISGYFISPSTRRGKQTKNNMLYFQEL